MKRLNVLRILFVIPILLGSMMTVTPAYSGGPVRSEENLTDTYEIYDCGFPITVQWFGTLHFTTWVDENGQETREFWGFGQANETWSANDKTISLQLSGPMHITIVSSTEWIVKSTGTVEKITLPGHGTVLGGAYQAIDTWILDEDENLVDIIWGDYHGLYRVDWQAICEYFAE